MNFSVSFSDHTPQFFPGEHYSRMRMKPWELKDYVQTVRNLQTEYAGTLQIHLGLEVEYYPAIFDELLAVTRDQGIEYFILGQHWNGNEEGHPYNGKPTEDEKQLKVYCNQVMDAMQTGLFTYLAHPDILHYKGSPRIYERHMRRLCREAKSCGLPLELNLMGLREERHYPSPLFWQIAAEEGCSVILGSDAHRAQHIANPDDLQSAFDFLSPLGLTPMETVDLISI